MIRRRTRRCTERQLASRRKTYGVVLSVLTGAVLTSCASSILEEACYAGCERSARCQPDTFASAWANGDDPGDDDEALREARLERCTADCAETIDSQRTVYGDACVDALVESTGCAARLACDDPQTVDASPCASASEAVDASCRVGGVAPDDAPLIDACSRLRSLCAGCSERTMRGCIATVEAGSATGCSRYVSQITSAGCG